MRGWVGALCLSWWPHDAVGYRNADGPHPDEDKHKAPASTQPLPLSLQDAGALLLPDSVVKIHQDTGGRFLIITPFGCQNSSGQSLGPHTFG